MEALSQTQLAQISQAYAELTEVHPEFKTLVDRQRIRETISGHEIKAAEIRKMVVESSPGENDTEISRHVEELVALSEGRPAILIRNDDFDLSGHDTLPNVLLDLLNSNRAEIKNAIRGVGRIEVLNHPLKSWLGTGFILATDDGRDIVVTNRHVAIEMAFRRGDGWYQFVEGLLGGSPIDAFLDLKEEVISVRNDNSAAIPIPEVLHIEDVGGPDLAFLRLGETPSGAAPRKLELSRNIEERTPVAVIGYPAKDTRETDLDIVINLLGDVFNKKRLSPGIIKSVSFERLSHDCSTFGGHSGSPIIDLRNGKIVGLHYGGTFPNPINHGVSATLLEQRLDTVLRTQRRTPRADSAPRSDVTPKPSPSTPSVESQKVTIEVPLRITVELGSTANPAITQAAISSPSISMSSAIKAATGDLIDMPGVASVRSGLEVRNGQYTKDPAIIVAIDHSVPGSASTISMLPQTYQSFPVRIRAATPEDLLRKAGGFALEGVPRINYEKPANLSLDSVDEEMFAVFHVSPDAGWPQLREFLSRTRKSLTIGLYNFATDHVEEELFKAVSLDPRTFDLVLGDAGIDRAHTDAFEQRIVEKFSDALNSRFRFELADGARRLFAGHYHIKVAVRDSSAFWLSSGNWEPSNQPNVDPIASFETDWTLLRKKNREWHAVILSQTLAETFEEYIKYDLESYREIRTTLREAPPQPSPPLFLVPQVETIQERPAGDAKYFKPLVVRKRLRIQPLLTPDNFIDHVIPLIESATDSIELQNQTLKWRHQNVDDRFEHMMSTLLAKHNNGVRVRFILRSDFSPEMKDLLVEHGFEPEQIRLLSKCHTKGMIVDSRRTLIGSHNLSEHGAFANRDASLIVDDEEVATYFREIFEFDWNRASRGVHETPPGVQIYRRGDPIPQGYELVSALDIAP